MPATAPPPAAPAIIWRVNSRSLQADAGDRQDGQGWATQTSHTNQPAGWVEQVQELGRSRQGQTAPAEAEARARAAHRRRSTSTPCCLSQVAPLQKGSTIWVGSRVGGSHATASEAGRRQLASRHTVMQAGSGSLSPPPRSPPGSRPRRLPAARGASCRGRPCRPCRRRSPPPPPRARPRAPEPCVCARAAG